MLTINLEKELIKANKKVVSAKELLFINEYENAGEIDNSVLERVGITTLSDGKRLKQRVNTLLQETKVFKQERVFHISQIEKICERYHLRFLDSYLFSGSVDSELPMKIGNFEVAYGVRCVSVYKPELDGFQNIAQEIVNNTFIAAPSDSFRLQNRPKDPLFFYKINDEYYYLIHKWGNDLSWFRRLYPFLSTNWATYLICIVLPSLVLASTRIDTCLLVAGFYSVVGTVLAIVCHDADFGFVDKNYWDSRYKD